MGSAQGVGPGKVSPFRPQMRLGTAPVAVNPGSHLSHPAGNADTLWPLCLYYLRKSFPTSLIETVRFYEDPTKIPRHIYQPRIKI